MNVCVGVWVCGCVGVGVGRGGGDHEHAGQHAHPPLAPQTHVSHEVNEGQRGGEEHGEPRHPRERDGEDGQHLCVRGSCLCVCMCLCVRWVGANMHTRKHMHTHTRASTNLCGQRGTQLLEVRVE